MLAPRFFDHGREIGVHWDRQYDPGLLLLKMNGAAANMLSSEPNDVRPTLRRVEQQREREPGSRPDWVRGLEFRDVLLSPSPITLRLYRGQLDALCRIFSAQSHKCAMRHQRSKSADENARRPRRPGFRRDHSINVRALQKRDPLVTVFLTEPLEDISSVSAGIRGQRLER